jgi:pyruvate dehydrogenase E2 component (dihydrolipoamide acetyltransferase)
VAIPSDIRRPLSRMRRAIAATMTQSSQVPQFTIERSARLDAVDERRSELAQLGVSISYQDFVVAAVAIALKIYPDVNSSFTDDFIIVHPSIHVGIAVAVPGGLVNPAVCHADDRSLPELAAERRRLTEAARSGKLTGDELFGATFSVSNLGPFGIERFTALVVPGQAAILAIGAAMANRDGPRVHLSLSCDHRVLDGVPAAEFLGATVDALEAPDRLGSIR